MTPELRQTLALVRWAERPESARPIRLGASLTPLAVRIRLMELGSSFRKFALSRGYEPRTVAQVVHRHAGKRRQIKGITTYHILRDLSRLIGREIIPGILEN